MRMRAHIHTGPMSTLLFYYFFPSKTTKICRLLIDTCMYVKLSTLWFFEMEHHLIKHMGVTTRQMDVTIKQVDVAIKHIGCYY